MRRQPLRRRAGVALTLRRRPRLRTAVIVVVGVLTGTAVTATVQEAGRARAAWGSSTSVLVAQRDLAAGDLLDHDNTVVEQRPAPLVPAGALSALPSDRRLATSVLADEVVRRERLAPAGLSAVAARLPDDTLAIAVPVSLDTVPPLAPGDRVDVLVALAPEAASGGAPGFALATDVAVVDVTDTAVTVAVPRGVAPRLAVAFGQGAVTLALVGAQRSA